MNTLKALEEYKQAYTNLIKPIEQEQWFPWFPLPVTDATTMYWAFYDKTEKELALAVEDTIDVFPINEMMETDEFIYIIADSSSYTHNKNELFIVAKENKMDTYNDLTDLYAYDLDYMD